MKLHSWDDVPWSLAGPESLFGFCSNSGSGNWAGLAFDIDRHGDMGHMRTVVPVLERYFDADYTGGVVRGMLGHRHSTHDQRLIDSNRKNDARMGYDVLDLLREDDARQGARRTEIMLAGLRRMLDHLSPRLEKSGQTLIGYVGTWPWWWEMAYCHPLYRAEIDQKLDELFKLWIAYPALSICFDLGTRWGPDHPFGKHMARVRDAKATQGRYTWIEATHPREHEHAAFNNTFASMCFRRRLTPSEMRPGTLVAVANKDLDKVEVKEIPRFIAECRANRMIPCVGIEHANGAPVTPRREWLKLASAGAAGSTAGNEIEGKATNG